MATHATGTREEWLADGGTARLGTADWLSLAAAPVFAAMALLTGVVERGMPDILCSAQGGSPLAGMVPDVPADERLPLGAMAETDLSPAKRYAPAMSRHALHPRTIRNFRNILEGTNPCTTPL